MGKFYRVLLVLLFLSGFAVFSLKAQLNADFQASTLSGCTPVVINFTNTSTGAFSSWVWNLGNNTSSTNQNVQVVYSQPGQYQVKLTITDGQNSDYIIKTVNVYAKPVVNFTVNGTNGCKPFYAIFHDLTQIDTTFGGDITSWQWDFGDGYSSFNQNPSHIYPNVGEYTVALQVSDENGCTAVNYVPNYIEVLNPPVASFTADNGYTCTSTMDVQFQNNSTGIGNTYFWQLGDTLTSTEENPLVTYSGYGSYDVTLTVTDQYGCSSTLTRTDFIQLTEFAPSFSLSKDTMCLWESIPYGSVAIGNTSFWDFGDNTTSTEQLPSHIYSNTGAYIITLILTDASGNCSDTLTTDVYVENITGGFTMDQNYGCDSLMVNFTDTSKNAVYYNWTYGNGDSDNIQNPSYYFTSQGVFNVVQVVGTSSGCYVSTSASVIIDFPNAGFGASALRLCKDSLVTFVDYSQMDTIISWNWNFDDGNTSNIQNPEHIFLTPGEYSVSLTVENSLGCIDSDTLIIEVGSKQTPAFTAVSTDTCAWEYLEFIDLSTDSNLVDEWNWYFEDDGRSFLQNPEHRFIDSTGYRLVWLEVGYNGCYSDSILDSVNVRGPIVHISNFFDCDSPFVYHFAIKVIEGTSYTLHFGDGDSIVTYFTDTVFFDTITHTYDTNLSIDYNAYVVAYNDTNYCDYSMGTIPRARNILAGYSRSDSLPCWNQQVVLDPNDTLIGSRDAVLWRWYRYSNTDTILTSSLSTHSYQFGTRGDYLMKLYVEDVNGCPDSITKHFRVYKPQVGFYSDISVGCYPFNVAFTDTSISDALPGTDYYNDTTNVSWIYSFGDTFTDSSQNTVHTYNKQGLMQVSLTVYDVLGCYNTAIYNNYVASPTPEPAFSISDSTICLGDSVVFTNNTSTVQGYGVSYTWQLGDNTTISGATPGIYTYQDTGYFSVSVYAVDTVSGLSCNKTLLLDSIVNIQAIPDAYVVADPPAKNCQYPPPVINFIDSTQNAIIASWHWDFDDGLISTNPHTVSHLYYVIGSYSMQMTVTTSNGCTDKDTVDVLIKGPKATINYEDTLCSGTEVFFSIDSTQNLTYYSLNFGDGDSYQGTEQIVSHLYQLNASVQPTIVLYTIYPEEPVDSVCMVPMILDSLFLYKMVANFTGTENSVCVPYYGYLQDSSMSAPAAWEWTLQTIPPDVNYEQNPYFEFPNTGNYDIQLIVTNSFGCKDTIVKTLVVNPIPVITVSDTNILCVNESVTLFVDAATGLTYTWSNGSTGESITVVPGETTEYTVTNSQGCAANYVVNVDQGVVDIPTAFTPNGDGQNDYLYLAMRDVGELLEYKIYNRWGQELFSTTNIEEGWDGSYNGVPQNIDTYVFMYRALTKCGTEVFNKGYVSLLR